MFYSREEKRKIILDNYNHPSKQVDLEELKKISSGWQVPFFTFWSLDKGCGDIIHLLISKKGDYVEKCLFSGHQSCVVTVAAANILCSYLEGKTVKLVKEMLDSCQLMVEGKEYDLNNCRDLEVFSDIFNFPHRVECINLVIRGIIDIYKKTEEGVI